jgi:hypothetical protein
MRAVCPGWTFDRLGSEGFTNRIVDALQSVTKRDVEDYDDFVRRSAADQIGRRVKLADLHDNSDISRIAVPTERDLKRIAKYRRAIDLIGRIPAWSNEPARKRMPRIELTKTARQKSDCSRNTYIVYVRAHRCSHIERPPRGGLSEIRSGFG